MARYMAINIKGLADIDEPMHRPNRSFGNTQQIHRALTGFYLGAANLELDNAITLLHLDGLSVAPGLMCLRDAPLMQ